MRKNKRARLAQTALERIKAHEHLCLIYESQEEWKEAIIPFIRMGIERDQKCIYIVGEHTAEELISHLDEGGIDTDQVIKSGQLVILNGDDPSTKDDPELMISLLRKETDKALTEGYTALRVTDEMTWITEESQGSNKVLEYEKELNRDIIPFHPCTAICQYNRNRFDPEVIREVIMTHPKILLGEDIYDNFYYIPPENFPGQPKAEIEVGKWLNIVERERALNERYRLFLEGTTDMAYLKDDQFRHMMANGALLKFFGKDLDQVIGRTDLDLLPPDAARNCRFSDKEALEKQKKIRTQEEIDGRYYETIKFPVNIGKDRLGVGGLIRDITDHKRAEEALRREHDLRQRYLDTTHTIMVALNAEGRITMINRAGCELLGYTEEELMGKEWFENFLPKPEGMKKDYPIFQRIMAGDLASNEYVENSVICKDGTLRRIGWHNTLLKDDDGEIVGTLGSGEDITDRKRAQEELIASETRYRRLFESAKDGILILDASSGEILDVNPFMTDMLGYSYEEFTGKHLWEIGVFQNIFENKEKFLELKERGYVRYSHLPLETSDGKGIDVEFVSNVYDVDRSKVIQCNIRDITERKKMEKELENTLSELSAIHQNAPIIMMLVDNERKVKKVNKAAAEFAKRSPEDMIGLVGGEALMCLNSLDDPEGCGFGPRCKECRVRNAVLDTFEDRKNRTDIEAWLPFPMEEGSEERCLEVSTSFLTLDGQKRVLLCAHDITDKKEANEALKASEERFRLLAENTLDLIWQMDMNLRFTYVNPASESLFGYTPEEFIGTHLSDHCDTSEFARVTEIILEGLQSPEEDEGTVVETVFHHKDGRRIPSEVHGKLLLDEQGRPAAIQGTTRDISDRRSKEDEINDLNSFLLSIRYVNQTIVKESDFDRILSETCRILTRIKGYMDVAIGFREEKTGYMESRAHIGMHERKPWRYVPEKDGDTPPCIKEVIQTGSTVILEPSDTLCSECGYCSHNMDHRSIHVPIRNFEGEPQGIISAYVESGRKLHDQEMPLFEEIADDLFFAHEKITSEKELIQSEKKYRTLIETTSEGYWLVDEEGMTLEVNDALCSMLGYDKDDIIGKSPMDFMDDDNKEIYRKMFRKRSDSKDRTYNIQLISKKGDVRDVMVSATTFEDSKGSPSGVFALITDISKLKRINDELEREKKKSDTFLDLISHDIGNIHQGILLSLSLLDIDPISDEMKQRSLANIRNLANRSMHLVKNVIILTKLDSMDKELGEIDVLEMMDNAIESCRSAFPKKKIRYDTVFDHAPVLIKAEPVVGEVFFNLFHNSIKVQQDKEPRIETEVIVDKEHSCVRIRISDWGPGISDDLKEKLLYRTRAPDKKMHSGIGLSLVRELMNRYHGRVRILNRSKDEPDSGTCFELTFPLPEEIDPVRQD